MRKSFWISYFVELLEEYGYARVTGLYDDINRKIYEIEIYLENGQVCANLIERDAPTFENLGLNEPDRYTTKKIIDYGYKTTTTLLAFLIINDMNNCMYLDVERYRDYDIGDFNKPNLDNEEYKKFINYLKTALIQMTNLSISEIKELNQMDDFYKLIVLKSRVSNIDTKIDGRKYNKILKILAKRCAISKYRQNEYYMSQRNLNVLLGHFYMNNLTVAEEKNLVKEYHERLKNSQKHL